MVLSRDEIGALLKQLTGTERLIVMLLYGSGVRLEECLELRVKDLDFDRHQIIVRQGAPNDSHLEDDFPELRGLFQAPLRRGGLGQRKRAIDDRPELT